VGRWSGARVTNARAYWAARILEHARAGRPILCPFCDKPVTLAEPWDVDHALELVDNGALGRHNQRPAHRSCNRSSGAATGNRRRTRSSRRIRG
jgi:hypothetical protein